MSLLRVCASTSIRHVTQGLVVESAFTGCLRTASRAAKDKEPLRKAKTPQGRFDTNDEKIKDPLEKFPDGVNPATKEQGARGPEPTRYGDWERKGRCVDF